MRSMTALRDIQDIHCRLLNFLTGNMFRGMGGISRVSNECPWLTCQICGRVAGMIA